MTIIWLSVGCRPSAYDPLGQMFKLQLVLFDLSVVLSIEKDRWSWPHFRFSRYRWR